MKSHCNNNVENNNLKNKINQWIKNFKNSKEVSFYDLPTCLKNKIILMVMFGLLGVIVMAVAAFAFKTMDFFTGGVLIFVVAESIALNLYYLFTRKKFIPLIVIPIEKRVKKAFRKKNYTYIIVGCCPDGTQRELNVSKKDYSQYVIGLKYVFYFAIDNNDKNKPDYKHIYGFEEYLSNAKCKDE